jgi:uncharacterized membrane protein YhhN
VTAAAWGLAAVAAVAALANWWSRWRDHRPTEVWSKPLTLLALIGVAVALEPVDPTVRAWFVVALVLSLAGDVFLLGGDRWFVAGLGSFLLGHLAYVVGFAMGQTWRWPPLFVVAMGLLVLAATVGRRIVASATDRDRKLRIPVAAYLGVISMMVMSAAAAWNAWALIGAVTFLVSDTVLGWRQFVERRPWMPVTIMVTYHLGQAGLVASLL